MIQIPSRVIFPGCRSCALNALNSLDKTAVSLSFFHYTAFVAIIFIYLHYLLRFTKKYIYTNKLYYLLGITFFNTLKSYLLERHQSIGQSRKCSINFSTFSSRCASEIYTRSHSFLYLYKWSPLVTAQLSGSCLCWWYNLLHIRSQPFTAT